MNTKKETTLISSFLCTTHKSSIDYSLVSVSGVYT